MKSGSIKTITAILIIVFGISGTFFLSNYLEAVTPPVPESFADEDLSLKGEKLKGYSLGFEGLIADWYWMRSLQYIGNKLINNKQTKVNLEDLNSLNPRLLYPLLDNATSLDPRFLAAYSFGALVLPAINSEEAITFIEKGIRNNPENWRFYQYLGFIYWKLERYEKAAQAYGAGSEIEGAPAFMKSMAAKMKSQGGERETARIIYQQLYDDAEDSQTKESARLRLLEVDSLEERDAIGNALEEFKRSAGRCASSWNELYPLLLRTKLPNGKDFRLDDSGNIIDPTGAPYVLDKRVCTVSLDAEKTKIPLR
ncbi:MAG: hypothetical protein KDB79_12160 [Acidobacteria bacterium]|nr:hypothetical protein [Acidobacteriota bacterium]